MSDKREKGQAVGTVIWANVTKYKVNKFSNDSGNFMELILEDNKLAASLTKKGITVKKLDKEKAEKSNVADKAGRPVVKLKHLEFYKDSKTGEIKKSRPLQLFNSKGRPISKLTLDGQEVELGNGSRVKVDYVIAQKPGTNNAGLRMNNVQILDLVVFGGSPFTEEEGSFVEECSEPAKPAVAKTEAAQVDVATDDTSPWEAEDDFSDDLSKLGYQE